MAEIRGEPGTSDLPEAETVEGNRSCPQRPSERETGNKEMMEPTGPGTSQPPSARETGETQTFMEPTGPGTSQPPSERETGDKHMRMEPTGPSTSQRPSERETGDKHMRMEPTGPSTSQRPSERETGDKHMRMEPTGPSTSQRPSETQQSANISVPTTAQDVEKEKKIIRVFEHFLGDPTRVNRHYYLKKLYKKSGNWLPLENLMHFRRIRNLSSDIHVFINALSNADSQLIQLSGNKRYVRRLAEVLEPRLNKEERHAIVSRSIFVKGFPATLSRAAIYHYFDRYDIEELYMRKYYSSETRSLCNKGSAIVTFKTVQQQNQVFLQSPLRYNGKRLVVIRDRGRVPLTPKVRIDQEMGRRLLPRPLPEASVLHFEVLDDYNLTRCIIGNSLKPFGEPIACLIFKPGDKECFVRFAIENGARRVYMSCSADHKLKVGNFNIPCRVLQGEEDVNFLEDVLLWEPKKRRQEDPNADEPPIKTAAN